MPQAEQTTLQWCTENGVSRLQLSTWTNQGVWHGFFDRAVNAASDTFSAAEHFPLSLERIRQVHGCGIVCPSSLNEASEGDENVEGDAWLVDLAEEKNNNVLFSIITADCVPILLRSKNGRYLAALHCGWRGATAGLLPKVLERLFERSVTSAQLELIIGPAARGCCYEVGQDVVLAVQASIPDSPLTGIIREDEGKIYCDIPALLRTQARRSGLGADQIFQSKDCTICNSRFFSYRREKAESGRQFSVIGQLGVWQNNK